MRMWTLTSGEGEGREGSRQVPTSTLRRALGFDLHRFCLQRGGGQAGLLLTALRYFLHCQSSALAGALTPASSLVVMPGRVLVWVSKPSLSLGPGNDGTILPRGSPSFQRARWWHVFETL